MLLASSALLRGEFATLVWVIGEAGLGWVVTIALRPSRRTLAGLLAGLLAIFAVVAVIEWRGSAWTWHVFTEQEGVATVVRRLAGADPTLEGKDVAERRWRAANDVAAPIVHLSGEVVSGEVGWQWERSEAGIVIERGNDATGSFTRVTVPEGRDPYLLRSYDAGQPVAGTTFRLTFEARSADPIPSDGCRGVWLQVWGPGGAASCRPVALNQAWATFQNEWTVPDSAASHVLRVVANDFDGRTFDLRRVRLAVRDGGGWRDVGPLLGAVPAARVEVDGEVDRQIPFQVARGHVLTSIAAVDRAVAAGQRLRVSVSVPDGATFALGPARLEPEDGWTPLPSASRRSLWLGHPNLAGHAAAATAASLLTVATSPALLGLGTASAFVVFVAAGSRTALWTFLAAAVVIALVRRARGVRFAAAAVALTAVIMLAVAPPGAERLTRFDSQGSAARPVIWKAALLAWQDAPWLGSSAQWPEALVAAGVSEHEATRIGHAHNLWLELVRLFGVPGAAASLWLTGGLAWIGWRHARWLGLSLVGAMLLLQVPDATLFNAWVLVPFVITLNMLQREPE